MKKYLNVIAAFVFAVTLVGLSHSSYAQNCEDMFGYDTGIVVCSYLPYPPGFVEYPGDPTCTSDPMLLTCLVDDQVLCTHQGGDYSCVAEAAACPGGADSNNFVCGVGQKCCDPPDPETFPECSTGGPYQSCRSATGQCTGSGAGGDGWTPADGNWSCGGANQHCCVHLCEVAGIDDYYCAASPAQPGDSPDSTRYCSGGETCYTANEVAGFDCTDAGGTCVNYPYQCAQLGGTIDDQGQCVSSICCMPGKAPITCVGATYSCIDSDVFQNSGCPSGFPDLNTDLTCEPEFTCCEARSECDPTSGGCINHGTYWDCPNCGTSGCGTDERCAVTATPGVYRCAPCTVNTECVNPGECGDDSCTPGGNTCCAGERCIGNPGAAYCYTDFECGLALLESNPYTGPIVSFNELLARAYFFLYPAGIAVGLFFIAKAGYTIMMSEGNPVKVSEGKEELTSAVLGTLFILLSLVILRVIISALLGATI